MTLPVSRHAALASLAFAIAAPSAVAQQSAAKALDNVVITATRTPQAAADLLSDTLTIGADELQRAGAEALIDVLQRQRGIEVVRNGGPGTNASVFIRGANSNQNVVLVDGVRIGSSTTGAANWSALPLSAIDRVEVVYGPLSTLYGADAIGGVVQIFTKQGAGAPAISAGVSAGSQATVKYDAAVAGSTGGEHSVSYALTGGKERSDGFSATTPGISSYNPDQDGYRSENANGRIAVQLAKDQEIGAQYLHSRVNAQYDNGPSAYDARTLQTLDTGALFSKNQLLPNWHSTLQLSWTRDEQRTDASAAASGKSLIGTTQTDALWQNDVRLGADKLQVLLERRKEKVSSSSTPVLNGERSTNSVAASYSLQRGAQLASASLRNDDSAQYGSHSTGSAGYGYRFSDALRATASVGTSFRAPTFNDLYYPGYGVATNRPERGRNVEGGLYFDNRAAQLSAVYYHNRVTDLLVSTSVCPVEQATHPFGCSYNVDHALLEGVTLAAAHRIGAFSLRGNADFQDPRNETTGKQLARRAKKHADFTLEYSAGALKTGVEWHLSGQRFDDAANKNALGGYGLLNLYASYQIAPQWTGLLRWDNASDKQYALARFYGTAGTRVFAGLRYNMK